MACLTIHPGARQTRSLELEDFEVRLRRFNTKGEVFGLTTFQMRKGQSLDFAIPIEKVLICPSTATIYRWEILRPRNQPHGRNSQ
jgi:hypothetical protein